jgi:hypothetical protein
LTIAPPSSLSDGMYEFDLIAEIEGGNASTLPLFINVTESGRGNLYIHVSDIYTATLDDQGNSIPGLENAKVEIQNEKVLTESYEQRSNEFGDINFENIPAGRYAYRITAFDHESKSGRIWVRAGSTVSEEALLLNKLVTVEFSVNEITLQDRYEILLEATYETNVPAPVVLIEPAYINLPMLTRGQIFQGEIAITNYGLVRADSVKDNLPRGNAFAFIEYLVDIPPEIDAGEVIIVPFRVVALKNFDGSETSPFDQLNVATAGCISQAFAGGLEYIFRCANKLEGSGGAGLGMGANGDGEEGAGGADCGGGGGGSRSGGSGSSSGGGGGGGGGGSGSARPTPTPLGDPKKCDSDDDDDDDSDDDDDCF